MALTTFTNWRISEGVGGRKNPRYQQQGMVTGNIRYGKSKKDASDLSGRGTRVQDKVKVRKEIDQAMKDRKDK